MPFLVTPEGKIIGQSGAIMKYRSRKGGKILLQSSFYRIIHNIPGRCIG